MQFQFSILRPSNDFQGASPFHSHNALGGFALTSHRKMKHTISARCLTNPNHAYNHLPLIIEAHMNVSCIIKVQILVLIK